VDKSDGARQLGQDRRDRIGGLDRWDRTDRTGQIRQDNRDGTTVAGQSGYGSWDRTTETGQPEQVNLDQTAWRCDPTQNREDKSGHDSNTRIAASGEPWTRLLGQDSWHRTSGIGELGCYSQVWTARTGQPEKTVGTVHLGQKTEDKIARTGQHGQDNKDRIARTTRR
jgi:hypothetical protein